MDPILTGAIGILVMLVLIVIGLPIGVAMGIVGFGGVLVLKGWKSALGALYFIPHSAIASFTLAVIPMFMLMGYLAFHLGLTEKAYDAAYKWLLKVPGGLAVATTFAAALFGACCGSSVAATASFGRMALPQMLGRKYDSRLASGCVAAAGTLAALIPPSILFVLYGIVTEQSIGKLLIAGVIPGIMTAVMFAIFTIVVAKLRPQLAPADISITYSWKERFEALGGVWPIFLLFLLVVGGIYSGVFTPTEAGAAGAFLCLLVGLISRQVTLHKLRDVTLETARAVAIIGVLIIGVFLLVQFVSFSGLPTFIAKTVASWHVPTGLTLAMIYIVYLILGCFLDAFGLLLLTTPFFFPVIIHLGLNPIWFGVIVVKLVEIGLLTPPVGVQVYVLKSVAPEGITTEKIFTGAMWYWAVDLATIAILTAFPVLSTWLPSLMRGG